MAGIKISALPPVASALLTDFFPVVQGGVTSQETLSQVATLFNANLTFLPIAGGTLTGALNLGGHQINAVADPTSAQDAATKNYVDQTALNGTSVYAASAATLGTVTQAGAGVGATLTNAGTQATFALDGVNPPVGSKVLIKNTATGMTSANEGIYTVTNVGSGATNWVLTRATSYDTPIEINNTGLIVIDNGSTLVGTAWYNTATIVTVDTTAFSYSQFGTPNAISKVTSQFLTSTQTYTPPTGFKYGFYWISGSGGSGAGASGSTAQSSAGGGGGPGGIAYAVLTAAQIGASQTFTAGAAVTGGVGASNGSNGNASSLGSLLVAAGGSAGTFQSSTATTGVAAGGASGLGTTGDVLSGGNPGSPGLVISGSGFSFVSGNGGSNIFGTGGIGNTSGADGASAGGHGGGGAGATSFNGGASHTGGSSTIGCLYAIEFS
jgi:hypothetical protein